MPTTPSLREWSSPVQGGGRSRVTGCGKRKGIGGSTNGQVGRLRLALESAVRDHPDLPRVVMLHFPPVTKRIPDSGFLEVMKEFEVRTCVYGHLHGSAHKEAVEGEYESIYLQLVSCDYLNFRPVPLHLDGDARG